MTDEQKAEFMRVLHIYMDARFAELTKAKDEQLESYQACARDKLAEISSPCTTLEDATRKLQMACGALSFIAGNVTMLEPAKR